MRMKKIIFLMTALCAVVILLSAAVFADGTGYIVTIGSPENGTITADNYSAAAGETVTLTATPAEGYALWSLYYYTAGTGSDSLMWHYILPDSSGAYSFTMPEENVTVGAYFIPASGTEYTIVVSEEYTLSNGTVELVYNSQYVGAIVIRPEYLPLGGVKLKIWKNVNENKVIHVILRPDSGYDLVHSNILDDNKHPLDTSWTGEHDEGDIWLTDDIAGHRITISPSFKKLHSVTVSDSIVGGTVTANPTTALLYDMTLTAAAQNGFTFVSWDVKDADGNSIEVTNNTFTMPDSDVTVSAVFQTRTVEVTYIDLDSGAKTVTATRIAGDEIELVSGWYAVTENVTDNNRIRVSRAASLILCDGAKLTAPNGINVTGSNSLTIYGQNGGTGTLTINGVEKGNAGIGSDERQNCGTVVINGGTVSVLGFEAGIGGGDGGDGGIVTINDGTVTAIGSIGSAAIGSGDRDDNGGRGGSGGVITINVGRTANTTIII